MLRRLLLATAAVAAVAAPLTVASPASAAIACTVTGKIPVINSQGHLNTHFAVNCTGDQSWTVFATVQADVNGTWQRAQDTNEVTVPYHGDATISAEVETGAWACAPGRLYRSHAVLENGNTDNSSAVTLC